MALFAPNQLHRSIVIPSYELVLCYGHAQMVSTKANDVFQWPNLKFLSGIILLQLTKILNILCTFILGIFLLSKVRLATLFVYVGITN